MQKICANPWCQQTFEITDDDLKFYDKVSPVFNGKKYQIPPPRLCPECRQQRRLAFRNERFLYRNKCGLTGASFITNISPDKPFPVYTRGAWTGDGWDAFKYALKIDNESAVFAKIGQLFKTVPRWGNYVEKCENCDFCINSYNGKDGYLVISSGDFEKCFYSQRIFKSYDCIDSLGLLNAELCYQCIDSENLQRCTFLQNCKQCLQCDYCQDCSSCQNCLLCSGLNHKQYCILNQSLKPGEYAARRSELLSDHRSLQAQLLSMSEKVPHKADKNIACEKVSGNALLHCKNIEDAFYVTNSEDSRFVFDSDHVSLSYDASNADYYTECYETGSAAWINRCAFCDNSIYLNDCYYCSTCTNCNYCFGCLGLKRKQYCIFNNQYTKEEYEKLVPKIIEKMKANKEWGEFFPVELSPFAYNETVAQEYFPLTKEEVIARGWKWRDQTDEMPKVAKVIPASKMPDGIEDVPDDIVNWAVECEATKRPFKIIKQELDFYRQMKLPIPHFHPDERHRQRMALRNPRKLWKRNCNKCGKEIETTYSPERPEIVYCEECYLKEVY